MSDRVFFDTNLLIYLISDDERKKAVRDLIDTTPDIFISTQVLNEFVNVCIKKQLMNMGEILSAVDTFEALFTVKVLTVDSVKKACSIKQSYGYSYYDSLIITSALESGCNILFTEDMQNGQQISDTLIIKNPFSLHI